MSFLEYSYGQGQWPLWHSIVIFILLLFLPKSSTSPLHAFPSLSIFFTPDSQVRYPRTWIKVVLLLKYAFPSLSIIFKLDSHIRSPRTRLNYGVLFLKYSSVSTRHFTFLLRFPSFFLSIAGFNSDSSGHSISRLSKLEQADYCHLAYSFDFVFLSMF